MGKIQYLLMRLNSAYSYHSVSRDESYQHERKEICGVINGGLTPGQTGRLTAGRKTPLTLTLLCFIKNAGSD
jgi:hypothetical protein